jgi:hypothetical protein
MFEFLPELRLPWLRSFVGFFTPWRLNYYNLPDLTSFRSDNSFALVALLGGYAALTSSYRLFGKLLDFIETEGYAAFIVVTDVLGQPLGPIETER